MIELWHRQHSGCLILPLSCRTDQTFAGMFALLLAHR